MKQLRLVEKTQDAPPIYYRAGEMRAIRDADRRRYRSKVIMLLLYTIVCGATFRLVADQLLAYPQMQSFAFLRPFVIVFMVLLVCAIWLLGIPMAFRRKF